MRNSIFHRSLLSLLLLFTSETAAVAGSVVLIASDGAPFVESKNAFKANFTHNRSGDTLSIIGPDDPLREADVVVTMGSTLAQTISHIESPRLHCMTLSAHEHDAALMMAYPIEDQFKLIQSVFPSVTRLGVVYSDDHSAELVAHARALSADHGLQLVEVQISDPSELSRALEGLANRVDMLWGVHDFSLYTSATAQSVLVFSFRNHIPFFGLSEQWVQAGAALGPSLDYIALGNQCARIAGELLDGTPETEIGNRTPSATPYSINLQSIEDMNLLVPPHIKNEARRVY